MEKRGRSDYFGKPYLQINNKKKYPGKFSWHTTFISSPLQTT